MLYSLNNQYPAPLPHRIRLSNGMTRTDVSTFTEQEIDDAGYVPVEYPPEVTSTQVVEWSDGWVIREKTEAELAIDHERIKQTIIRQVQDRLDQFAASRGYGDEKTSPIVSACSYAASTHPKYGPEGRHCLEMREQTWDKLYQIMDEVNTGTRPVPTGYSDIAYDLPDLIWPDQVNTTGAG